MMNINMYNVLKLQSSATSEKVSYILYFNLIIHCIHLYYNEIRSYTHNILIDRSDEIVNVSMLIITTTYIINEN